MFTKLLDISFWQGDLDFLKIKQSGYDYIILRAGYGTIKDTKFDHYVSGCNNAGIKIVGVYWFIYATTLAEVQTNVKKCLEVVKSCKPNIIFADFEYDTITKAKNKGVTLTSKECNSFTLEFCEYVKKNGYIPGYYCNLDYYKNMYSSEVKNKGYVFWLAHYNSSYTYHEPPIKCDFYQYTDRGTIDALPGKKFDTNVCFSQQYLSNTCSGFVSNTVTNKTEITTKEGGEKTVSTNTISKDAAINAVIKIAQNEIGYLEKKSNSNLDSKTANAGSANYTKYWRDIKSSYQGQPWCACFVTWCFVQAFGKDVATKLLKHYPYVYCPTLGSLFTKNANPKVGDIVIFYKNGTFAHTGIVTKVSGDQFWTIEGNTSGGSTVIANGGGVCAKTYLNSNLPGTKFCTPDYSIVKTINSTSIAASTSTSTSTTKSYLSKGDTGNKVKELQANLKILGYTGKNKVFLSVDGDFGENTEYAVKCFQKNNGLTVDGKAGTKTLAAITSALNAKKTTTKTYTKWIGKCKKNGAVVYKNATGTEKLSTYSSLNSGNLVEVTDKIGNRYKILIAGKYVGYVFHKFIEKNTSTTAAITKTTTATTTVVGQKKYPFVGKCKSTKNIDVLKEVGKAVLLPEYPHLANENLVDVLGVTAVNGTRYYKIKIAGKHIGYVLTKYIRKA